MRDHVLLYVNGRREIVSGERVFQSLSDFLRYDRQLVGTKVVCAEGDCGSCCVLIGTPIDGQVRYHVVTSCIQYVFMLDGCHVVTVEGLRCGGKLSCIQESMIACQGSQCGFCTPGFVVAMHGLLESRETLTESDLRLGLSGNLCRCTGYEAILKAGTAADVSTLRRINDLFPAQNFAAELEAAAGESVLLKDGDRTFFKPRHFTGAAEFKARHPGCTVIAGGTDIGVVMNKGKLAPKAVMTLSALGLDGISVSNGVLTFGAMTTLAAAERACCEHLPEMAELLRRHGSPPIRNAGTVAGNIANGSPIGDTMPALFVLNAEIELQGIDGSRRVNINGFYTGYRATVMKADELITAVHVPLPADGDQFRIYKISKRHDLDISTFGAAFWMRTRGDTIEQVRIAYGGVGPVILRLTKVEGLLTGQSLCDDLIESAAAMVGEEITPISDVRGGKDYRLLLGQNILRKFLSSPSPGIPGEGGVRVLSNGQHVEQLEENPHPTESGDGGKAVGQNIPHDSARGHVSGESVFIDDMPPLRNELLVDFLGSPFAAGRLVSIDLDEARRVPGVVALLTARDIPGHNCFGPVMHDEHLLASDEIVFLGDPCVLIVAESRKAIAEAKKRIKLNIEPAKPIFTIEEAVEAQSLIGPQRVISRGDADGAMLQAEVKLSGEFRIGGQEHFYLENQAAIAIPGEHGHMAVHSSTQHPSECQAMIAEILGLPFNHVVVHCKRMGGGFGGKETQAAQPAMMAALAARHTQRPCRVVYNKDDDMRYTGKRHPFLCRWTAGCTRDGVLQALKMEHYANGGCTCDLSLAVMERAMLHTDNAYFIPHVHITGQVVKTNLPSNTAFRGFGGPQGVASIENVLQSIAHHLGLDAMEVRRRNLYGLDTCNTTPYGQVVKNNTLHRLFHDLARDADYNGRRRLIDAHNGAGGVVLRGLAATPVKFGISFTKQHLNQANALVSVYTDGTVMVSTGGTEMGQGVNTRVRQIVADEFAIDWRDVYVTTTSTDKNHNTSPTAASTGTDLNGAAAMDACQKIRSRLRDFAARHLASDQEGLTPSPDNIHFGEGRVFDDRVAGKSISFKDLVLQAYMARVNLGERGFYATPGVDYNRETGKGTPFLYYTNGLAISEVAIDRYTGEMRVARVDLLMDIGQSINPGLDRGQVVGGFIQGMGWCTTEELKYDADGHLLSYSPTTYKIPNITDLPPVFNVRMLDNPDNVVSLKRSKAVGEPPLLLGLSVWAAVKDALGYLSPGAPVDLQLPATNEQILMLMNRLQPVRGFKRVPAADAASS